MSSILYVKTQCCTAEQINDLVLALLGNASDSDDVYGLIMTPTTCKLCVWRGGKLEGGKTNEEAFEVRAFEKAFEVRAFCSDWELRWTREGINGIATLLSERQISACSWSDAPEIKLKDTLDRSYLLWGERESEDQDPNWTTLTNGRTGPINVPVENCTSRIQLKVREYLARFEHGNVCVFDQRLIGLADAED